MTDVSAFGMKLGEALNRRRRVTVELPELAIRAIEWRVEEANARDPEGEDVTFNDVVEWLLVSEVTVGRMALIEQSIPGFTAAMFVWLTNAAYQPDERDV